MKSKKMDNGSKDIISNLPEALICHILSFLPIEDSALTSVLAKKWRYLFAFTPNLDFDDSVFLHQAVGNRERDMIPGTFMSFVERVLRLQENSTVNKFSLKCGRGVYSFYIIDWISNVLERGVSDLDLRVTLDKGNLPSEVFVSKSMVNMRIEAGKVTPIDVEDVFLPKLKTLYLNNVMLGKAGDCFDKLTYGSHVLEELVLENVYSNIWNRSVSSNTLKRLTLWCIAFDKNPDSVSFDVPNVVCLVYSDYVAGKYPKVNLGSVVEANIDLAMTSGQFANASYGHLVGNATDFLMAICNVHTLHLSGNTLEVLTFCCEPIPVFNNLIHLTIKPDRETGWESLPILLKNSPNLETLVFEGFHHRFAVKCYDVDGCLCKYSGEIPSCLLSSRVKVLKILEFGQYGIQWQMEQVKYFLETMPRLEQFIIHYVTSIHEDFIEELRQIQMLPTLASPNCKIQVISDKLK